jgi:hypothetical protein
VPEIEQCNRTTKERTRSVLYNKLPLKQMPSRIIIEMVYSRIFWLNMFPHNDRVYNTISPRSLIIGLHVDYLKHCRLEFGTYIQVHKDHANTMTTRTTGAITLGPTGNAQGGYHFYSLVTTGRKLNQQHWTELPMPQEVICRVHVLARRSKA